MIDRDDILVRLDQFKDIQHELEAILQTLVLNDSTIIDALAQMLGLVAKLSARTDLIHRLQERLSDEIRSLTASVAELHASTPMGEAIVLPTDQFLALNPEVALLLHLSSYVEDRTAVDVGAHVGDVAERLLDGGWRVYAFEPYPPNFAALEARLGGRTGFAASPVAIGAADGEGKLRIAHTLTDAVGPDASLFNSLIDHPLGTSVKFSEQLTVALRSLASLREAGDIPARIGLIKIDTEGGDIDVIGGLGAPDVAIVMAEFWDARHAFGQGGHGHLAPIVEAMRAKGYVWHVVVYHLDEQGVISYYFNHAHTVPGSWGNVVFFRDQGLFARAARWCETALRSTVHR